MNVSPNTIIFIHFKWSTNAQRKGPLFDSKLCLSDYIIVPHFFREIFLSVRIIIQPKINIEFQRCSIVTCFNRWLHSIEKLGNEIQEIHGHIWREGKNDHKFHQKDVQNERKRENGHFNMNKNERIERNSAKGITSNKCQFIIKIIIYWFSALAARRKREWDRKMKEEYSRIETK